MPKNKSIEFGSTIAAMEIDPDLELEIDQIRLFGLQFKPTGARFGFSYADSNFDHLSPSIPLSDVLAKLDTFIGQKRWPHKYRKIGANQPARKRTDLSIHAPRNEPSGGPPGAARCLFVFELQKLAGGLEWRFSTEVPPFSISAKESEMEYRKEVFSHGMGLKKCSGDSYCIANISTDPTKLAAFVFDYDKFTAQVGKYPDDGGVYPFNIHLEVSADKHANSSTANPKFFKKWIPIIVDPDVGHPGGSYPPPPPPSPLRDDKGKG